MDDRWDRRAAAELCASVVVLVLVLAAFTRFLGHVEARPGVVLADPLLARLRPRDLTWLAFGFIYASLVAGIATLAPHPRRLALGVQAYVVMVLLRMAAMHVTPLDPPPGAIPLQDPMVELLGTGGRMLTRDLFFSGHTATLTLVALTARATRLRLFFAACTAGVAACLLLQAVHYTVDVLAAPAFAFAAYRIACAFHRGTAPGAAAP